MTVLTGPLEDSSNAGPRAFVARLNRALLELRAELEIFGDSENAEKVLEIARETFVLQAAADAYLVTVAGTQGAGKTTLVREIYHLDGDDLRANLGQGERMPVAVLESSDIEAPRRWITRVAPDELLGVRRDLVTQSEWENAVRGNDPEALVLGLDVPATFFGADSAGFLLLPGYTTVDARNHTWQDRMRGALMSSPACVVVTDRDRLASDEQQVIVDDLRKLYLEEVNPVVAIARCDTPLTESERSALANRAIDVFGRRIAASDVFFTGVGEDARTSWFEQLRERLRDGFVVQDGFKTRQLSSVRNAVAIRLNAVLQDVTRKGVINEVLPGHGEYAEFLLAFDDSAAQARDDFEKQVLALLGGQHERAKSAIDHYIEKAQGWPRIKAKLGYWVKARNDVRRQQWNDEMLDFWTQASPTYEQRATFFSKAQATIISRAVAFSPPEETEGAVELAEVGRQARALTDNISENALKGLQFIAGNVPGADRPPDKELVSSVRLMPAMGLEALIFGFQVAQQVPAVRNDASASPTPDQALKIIDEINTNRKVLLGGLMLMVGVDVADDGIDVSIPGLAAGVSSFLFGQSEAAGAAAFVSTTVAIAAVVGAAAGAVVMAANMDAASDRESGYAIISGMRDGTYEAWMSQFDDILKYLRDRLISRLRGYLDVDEKVSRQLEMRRAVADVETARADLLKSLGTRP